MSRWYITVAHSIPCVEIVAVEIPNFKSPVKEPKYGPEWVDYERPYAIDITQVPHEPRMTLTAHVRCVGPDGQVKWEADTVPVVIRGEAS